MWVKSSDSLCRWTCLVNLDKVQYVSVYGDGDSFSIVAYLDDGGLRVFDDDTRFNKIDLFQGTHKECEDYMGWLQGELDVNYGVAKYHKPKLEPELL